MAHKQLRIAGLWGGENSGDDATEIDPLESPDMVNVDPSGDGGVWGKRGGRHVEENMTLPIFSEFNDGTDSGGRITGIFEFFTKDAGLHLVVTHAKGVDTVERRGPSLYISTSSPLDSGIEGSAYSDTVTAKGGKSTYTWSLYRSSLPGGLSLAGSTTATETIAGTPTQPASDPTEYIFTLKVVDSSKPSQKEYKRFTISISQNNPM